MIIETRAADPFFKNGFVIGCEDTREGVVIDPGDEVDELLAAVDRHKLTIRYILLTHAHLDHVTGVAAAKQALEVPVGLHRDDNFLYEARRSAGADVRAARRAAAEGRLLLRRCRSVAVRQLRRLGPPHARPLPGRRLPRDRPRRRGRTDPDRRRHAVRGLNRPDRSSRRRSTRRCCDRFARSCSRSRTTRSSTRATASRRRSGARSGRTRFCNSEVLQEAK